MVWFECGSCGDSIKKPKVPQHTYSCAAGSLTCIDCSRTFDQRSYKAHNTCVTESQKYAEGATKPGGFASKGFFDSSVANGASAITAAAVSPMEDRYLSTQAPWKCSICHVSCTSSETLLCHASGKKHIRRAQALARADDDQVHTKGSQAASQAAAVEANDLAADVPAADTKVYKWKKLGCRALKANGGVMKTKRLQDSVLDSIGATTEVKPTLKVQMLSTWSSSSQFVVDDKSIRLKA